jgi:PAS domain S-box-containing protein
MNKLPSLHNIGEIEKHIAQAAWCGPSGICVVDRDGKIMAANEHMCRILNYTEREMVGKHFNEFTLAKDQSSDAAEFESLIRGDKDYYHMDKTWIGKLNTPISGHLYAARCESNDVVFAVSQVIEGLSPQHAVAFAVMVRSMMEDWLQTQGLHLRKKSEGAAWHREPIVWAALAGAGAAWPIVIFLIGLIRRIADVLYPG